MCVNVTDTTVCVICFIDLNQMNGNQDQPNDTRCSLLFCLLSRVFLACREQRSQETDAVLTKVGFNAFNGKTVCERGMSWNEGDASRSPQDASMRPMHGAKTQTNTVFVIQQGSNQMLCVST